jgi:hypothetical protein
MMTMAEPDVIDDVRKAKSWLDAQSTTFDEMILRLRAIEMAYQNRQGEYAAIPKERTASVRAAIDSAENEPGKGFLHDSRSARLG